MSQWIGLEQMAAVSAAMCDTLLISMLKLDAAV